MDTDFDNPSGTTNHDLAGTPENFKQYVVFNFSPLCTVCSGFFNVFPFRCLLTEGLPEKRHPSMSGDRL